jgi:ankyrin repeat protein
MSRRLSIQYKNSKSKSPKPKVKFADDLVFLDSIKVNDVESVRLMLRRTSADIDINKINDYGLTALHQCVLENSIELVKLLIESNADVNIQDEDSWTPLHAG